MIQYVQKVLKSQSARTNIVPLYTAAIISMVIRDYAASASLKGSQTHEKLVEVCLSIIRFVSTLSLYNALRLNSLAAFLVAGYIGHIGTSVVSKLLANMYLAVRRAARFGIRGEVGGIADRDPIARYLSKDMAVQPFTIIIELAVLQIILISPPVMHAQLAATASIMLIE